MRTVGFERCPCRRHRLEHQRRQRNPGVERGRVAQRATLLAVTQDGDTYKATFEIAVQLA